MKGYTLIELVMVILLLAIISIAGAVSISSYKFDHLQAAADKLAADLLYAKNYAQLSNKWIGIKFSLPYSYTVFETDGTTDTNLKDPSNSNKDQITDLTQDYKGISLLNVNIGDGTKIVFNPFGAPFTNKNGLALSSNGLINLTDGSSTITISITPIVGRIIR